VFTQYVRPAGALVVALLASACSTEAHSESEFVTGVPISAFSVARTGSSVSLQVRDSVQLKTVSIKRSIRWSTTDGSVATVSRNGTVVGMGAGTAIVTASSGSTLERTTVNVTATSVPVVTNLSLDPATVQLTTGGSQQFSVSARWSDGSATVPPVTYSATGGSISSNGLYTAGSLAGTFMVVASCSCGLADTSVVALQAPPAPQLMSLRISPKTVSVAGGATVQFSTTAMWSTGETTLPPISYSAINGGSVNSATGLFVAPSTSGTYRVVVSNTGGSVRDTATVSVTGTSTDPSTPAPTNFTRNLPQNLGLQQLFDTRFGNMLNNQLNADGIGYVWDGRNATDATAPFGPNVFETVYAGNSYGNGTGGAKIFDQGGRNWRRIYYSLMMFIPNNYVVHSNEEKFWYPLVRTGTTMTGFMMSFWPGENEIVWKIYSEPGTSDWIMTGARVQKGRWTNVEVFMELNTPGNKNGVLKVWVDGQVSVDRTNILYYHGAVQGVIDGIRFDGTRGGGTATVPTPPEGQVRKYNRLAFFASN
jgi:hypothetical protein